MAWFKRKEANISATEAEKKETPDGLWSKCEKCGTMLYKRQLVENAYVCYKCSFHFRVGSEVYFSLLFDNNEFEEYDANMISKDMLGFVDTKKYSDRIKATIKKSGLNDACRYASGTINGMPAVIACMDFSFIGGSMGSVMGEKIARGIDKAIEKKCPFIMISKSGGARMMEATFSLMQMAKSSAKLTQLAAAKLPYFSVLTDPTTGGVTASFAMLGDFNIAEPGALIGFAGPRVIRQTIGKDLPPGFQTSEFVQDHGFLDFIVTRQEMKEKIGNLMAMLK
ncbi:MAG: acetyl-CoA carboxylase, carboxyltransferase subunit beta [Bacteroidetes bacterium]|nr:acetyl-CoA carboxylase, carboxyltransferase subunit beta [Bacteroidota bacterium]